MKKNIVSLTLLALSMAFTSTLANAVTPTSRNTIVCTVKGPLGVDSVGVSLLRPLFVTTGYQVFESGTFYSPLSSNDKTLVVATYSYAEGFTNGVFGPVEVRLLAKYTSEYSKLSDSARTVFFNQARSQSFTAPFAELEAGGIDRVVKVPAVRGKKVKVVEAKLHCGFSE
jgi:hypothetical protein